ncbi:MAG: chromosome segregation protein, partial [Chloroflexota bacterium]|nr:chromosome segregation protein [Chloroflexota bacterium]
MSAPARLLALRLQGFKSFAERTVIEFGPGISAVVGPNGSGKSNLADALRWALGEQGRALRSRKSEDVIFAGSERRAALGMADVTLVLDNADGLLPVEYGVLELGRRLYRSGENDYLLNRQRVRLRDLVDLLDSAHLADNAFLFIGQGMVDQALALRPEERRPLFEEVAGVRRHERRRRKAEEQLTEAELNLARVDDILAELRPQARRLAAQAEQQVTRASAGDELASALVAAAHGRWHEATIRHAAATERLTRARADAERSTTELSQAEAAAAAVSAALGARVEAERVRREAYEVARSAHLQLQLREARLASDLAAVGRDRERLRTERSAAEADLALRRREAAIPVPAPDADLQAALAEAERGLSEALEEIGTLRAAGQARGDELAAVRRAEAARLAELETARRRLVDADRRAAAERSAADRSAAERIGLEDRRLAAARLAGDARAAEQRATSDRELARDAADRGDGAARAAAEAATAAGSRVATLRGRLEAVRARLAEDEARGIARAARRVGGRRLDEDLQIEPDFRAAVGAALGEVARAYLVGRGAVPGLAAERGTVVVEEGGPPAAQGGNPGFVERLDALGGGVLADVVRRDPLGSVRRVLARVAWVPDLESLLELQPLLPAGWSAVTRDGGAAAGPIAIALGRAEGPLERRAELDRLEVELAAAEAEASELERAASAEGATAAAARIALETARAGETAAAAARRGADEAERAAGRAAENVAREAVWQRSQAERAEAEATRLREVVATLEAASGDRSAGLEAAVAGQADRSALATWEERA